MTVYFEWFNKCTPPKCFKKKIASCIELNNSNHNLHRFNIDKIRKTKLNKLLSSQKNLFFNICYKEKRNQSRIEIFNQVKGQTYFNKKQTGEWTNKSTNR